MRVRRGPSASVRRAALAALACAASACGDPSGAARAAATTDSTAPMAGPTASDTTAPPTSAPPTASAEPAADAGAATPAACPADMALVAGAYCPDVEQKCESHTKDYEQQEKRREQAKAAGKSFDERPAPERCTRFAEPSRCLSRARTPLRFCMDRYEWPNHEGELPAFLVTWTQAKALCAGVGKRLCTADEFNFACEGEDLRPYSYGYVRDAARCNVDKPYVQPDPKLLLPYELCMQNARCKAHAAALDQREPAGSRADCTSPFGIFDLNGNVNEWVERPGQTAPRRSGLKGGWWGPARSRCRPMVTAHDENYVGYEVGFRCCADARGA